ncbi:uncharacterized protein LOC111256355 [Setaria italica]|uniref:uncharacterized protein LOC111256355 n=1 Tax=Setaria italica TaxID=4555 RepID=UPI000351296E|nr:uncharacterized protein LOC111256355 [Setaria italica]
MERPDPKKSAASAAGFPDDVLLEILSRLPVKPLRRSKCVSKGWRDLLADPLHRKKLPQTLECLFYGRGDFYTCGDDFGGLGYGHFINLLGTSATPIVDPSFPLLKDQLPGVISTISLVGSCNGHGLLLFEHEVEPDMMGHIVCNPATGQLVTVPVDSTQAEPYEESSEVHIYPSETGAWSCRVCDWGEFYIAGLAGAFVNGMPYFISKDAKDLMIVQDVMVAVDVEGNKRKIIPVPLQVGAENYYRVSDYVGQSQGRLHYIYHIEDTYIMLNMHAPSELSSNINTTGVDDKQGVIYGLLLIWVLEDYDTQRWVLKHTISLLKLFGKKVSFQMGSDYSVVTIHPDRNLVFFAQHWNQKLISYDMDSREVCDICTLPHGYESITPYVPYFSELASLENKH